MRGSLRKTAFAILALFAATPAHANVGQTFGFGSRNAALAGSTVSWSPEAFASYVNPAILGTIGEHRLLLSHAVLYMHPSFTPIDNVVLENNFASDKVPPRYGKVDTDYDDTFGQALGIAYQFEGSLHLGLGATLYLPLGPVAQLDTGETFIPEYVLERSRTQHPQIEFGFGVPLSKNLFFGAGLHTGFSIESKVQSFLQTDSTRPSYMRLSTSAKPKLAPYLGLLIAGGDGMETAAREAEPAARVAPPWSVGAVVRFPLASQNQTRVEAGTGLFTGLPSVDVNFDASSAILYDPLTLEFGAQFAYSARGRLYVQVDYEAWSQFEPPTFHLQNPSGLVISTENLPAHATHSIVVPRIGHELELGSWRLRAGVAYRPSIYAALPTEAGNSLDPPRIQWQLGAGFDEQTFFGLKAPHELAIHLAWHQLTTQEIAKSPGNEAGTAGDEKIGAPGYEAGGKILGAGVSLSFAL